MLQKIGTYGTNLLFLKVYQTQLDKYGSDELLEVILVALMVSRLPPALRSHVIRNRRGVEYLTGQHMDLENFLDHLNELIHYNELACAGVNASSTHEVKTTATSKILVTNRNTPNISK